MVSSRNRNLNWETHKALLKHLYLERDMKLADVRDKMVSEHSFAAT
jgi:hypothetical protein